MYLNLHPGSLKNPAMSSVLALPRLRQTRQFAAGAFAAFCVIVGDRLWAASSDFVAINATAIPDYVRPVDAQGTPRGESYVFTEGRFFGGRTADSSLTWMKFDEVVKILAPTLARQNYFPTREASSADLLLMVHWGTTDIHEDPLEVRNAENLNAALNAYQSAAAEDSGNADPGALNAAIGERKHASTSAQGAIARNAALLGYKPSLEREQRRLFPSAEEHTMNEELNEERYFVVVIAYDYQFLRNEKKSRRLWATRISIRSLGNNFVESLPAIAEAGAAVYGRNVDHLVRVKARSRDGRVDLGDLKILGTVESSTAATKAR